MPLTPYQEEIARLLSANRSFDSYLAGGAAIYLEPNTRRYSNDMDYTLHPIDLAINKLLALVGRDEPRDFLDILDLHNRTLPIGALCWAAAGKDPGFTPYSLLEIMRRRGRYHREDFERLKLAEPVDLPALKTQWLAALSDAEAFVRARPPDEVGCLYYSPSLERFVAPGKTGPGDAVPHYGRPGGVLPRVLEES